MANGERKSDWPGKGQTRSGHLCEFCDTDGRPVIAMSQLE